VYNLYNSSQVR